MHSPYIRPALITVSVPALLSAADVWANNSVSLGEIAGNVHGSASILARFMWAACIIIGIILAFTAFTQFQTHRKNPKLVPLINPAVYLLLSLLTIGIPFADRIFGYQDADDESDKHNATQYIDIDKN